MSQPSTIIDPERVSLSSVSSTILQKQREMIDLNEYRIKSYEEKIKKLEQQIQKEKEKYLALKKDFEYNYKLLEGRDVELEKYEKVIEQMKKDIKEKEEKLTEMKSELTDKEDKLKRETARNNETEIYYQERIIEMKNEFNLSKQQLEDKHRGTTKELEVTIRELKRQVEERDETIEKQKLSFDQDLHEVIIEKDEQITKLLVQIREKDQIANRYIAENENLKRSNNSNIKLFEEKAKSLQETIEELSNNHQSELEEIQRMSSVHSQGLISNFENAKTKLQNELEDAKALIKNQKEQIKNIQRQLEDTKKQCQTDTSNIKMEFETKLRQKEIEIEEYKEKEWEVLQTVETKEETLNTVRKLLEDKKKEIESLQKEIKSSIERENEIKREVLRESLQRDQEQEERERVISLKHEQLIKALRKERDDSLALLKDKDKHIEELRKELQHLQNELTLAQIMQSVHDPLPNKKKQSPTQSQPQSQTNNVNNSRYQQIANDIDDELGLGSLESVSMPSSIGDFANSKMSTPNNNISFNQQPPHQPVQQQPKAPQGNLSFDLINLSVQADQVTRVNSLITELRLNIEEQKEKLVRMEEKLIAASKENKLLRTKLKEAVKDLKKLYKEKEQLTDISNMLKAELSRTKEAFIRLQQKNILLEPTPNFTSESEEDTLAVSGKVKSLAKRKEKTRK
ncbi:hypothetical protein ABK040_014689 [Willaertia magna]